MNEKALEELRKAIAKAKDIEALPRMKAWEGFAEALANDLLEDLGYNPEELDLGKPHDS